MSDFQSSMITRSNSEIEKCFTNIRKRPRRFDVRLPERFREKAFIQIKSVYNKKM